MSSLKGEFVNFLICPSDATNYDKIWTENGDLIDSFIPEILTFNQTLVLSPCNIILRGIRWANKKISEPSL